MKIAEIKEKMTEYEDMFGGNLIDGDNIKKAKTKEELAAIIDSHNDHLEMVLNDAQNSLSRFKTKLGLNETY